MGALLQRTAITTTNVVDTMASAEALLLGAIFQYIFVSDIFTSTHNPFYVVFLLVVVAVEAAIGMLVLLCSIRSGVSVIFLN